MSNLREKTRGSQPHADNHTSEEKLISRFSPSNYPGLYQIVWKESGQTVFTDAEGVELAILLELKSTTLADKAQLTVAAIFCLFKHFPDEIHGLCGIWIARLGGAA